MKRTMRREIYEAHDALNKSAKLKKRYRKKLLCILRIAFVILIPIIIITSVTAALGYLSDEVVKQAKTPAIDVVETDISIQEIPSVDIMPMVFEGIDEDEDPGYIIDINKSKVTELEETVVEEDPGYIIDINPPVAEVETPEVEETVVEEDPGHIIDIDPPVAEVEENQYQYTEEDYEYLLMTLVGEAHTYSKKHQMYVGSVVLNRLHSKKYFKYATCIKDVVLAKGQYACFKDGNAYRDPTELNIEVAKELIAGGSILPENVIYQAEFKQGDGVYEKIGNTYFCYQD